MNRKLFTFLLLTLSLVARGSSAQPPRAPNRSDPPPPPLPVVEIQINRTPETTDDFVTSGPTVCQARVRGAHGQDVAVVLTNDPEANIPDGGDVLFAAFKEPWPAGATATEPTLALTLPADGRWVPFVLAGKPGKPSAKDKDAVVEAHLAGEVGEMTDAVLGKQALTVRKNANERRDPGHGNR